jgi:hypothetical protein
VYDNMKGFKWVAHLFFLFSIKILDVLIPIQKQSNYFKHSELSVLSILYMASYPKQLSNCHKLNTIYQWTNYLHYYILILFKQFHWVSCCHLTFVKFDILWLILVLTLFHFHFHFSFWCNKTITVFCIGQYELLWTWEINIHLSLKASVNIVFKVHINSHWPQQKTIIV